MIQKRPLLRFEFLAELILKHGLTRGAELGLWKGKTFFYLLDHCPNLVLFGVDQWIYHPERKNLPGGETYQRWNMNGLRNHVFLGAQKYKGRAQVMHMSTADAALHFPDNSLDFVFIDGDHSEAGVRADITNWLPKIRPGGFITGHDISWKTVRLVVDELVSTYQVSSTHSDAVWYRQIEGIPNNGS